MSDEETGIDTAQAETVTEEVTTEETATSEEVENEESQETESEEQPEEPPKPRGAAKRISELTANWRNAERDRDYWRELAMQKRPETAKPEPTQTPVNRPTLEEYGYDEAKYEQALTEYLDGQIDQRLTQREQQTKEQQQQQEFQRSLEGFFQKGTELSEDFVDVVRQDGLPITEVMRDACLQMDQGPKVMYHLAQNPSEADRISRLAPYAQAAELGRLEVRLSMPQPKTVTSAPPPIKPLSAGGESASKNPDDMTVEEWTRWRQETLKR